MIDLNIYFFLWLSPIEIPLEISGPGAEPRTLGPLRVDRLRLPTEAGPEAVIDKDGINTGFEELFFFQKIYGLTDSFGAW